MDSDSENALAVMAKRLIYQSTEDYYKSYILQFLVVQCIREYRFLNAAMLYNLPFTANSILIGHHLFQTTQPLLSL